MPTKVLIIDTDAQFATQLAKALTDVGAETTVTEDPNQGLQHAVTDRPQLIVLSVELHKTNGFSICQRIKRESSISNIPVVLVTTNATDVTIEQHRQRPNHADDYIRKPIAVDALLERLRAFVSLGQSIRPSAPPDDDIVIDDDILEVEELRPSKRPPMATDGAVDTDMSNFADAAFQGLMTESAPPSSPPLSAPSSLRPSQIPSPVASAPGSIAPSSTESSKVRIRVLEDELDDAKAKIEELESRDLSAKEAELEALRRELDDAKGKLLVSGRPGGGSSAREVLDLREQLHKKEKELLDLRDKVTQREKEVLSLKDTSLDFERQKADLSDKLDDIARQLTEAQRHIDAARADKEAANKRNDDSKRRIEKVTQQLEEKAVELDAQRTAFNEAQAQYANERAQLAEEQKALELHAAEELRAAMARASAEINLQAENAQKHLEDSLSARDIAHQETMERALAEVRSAADSRLSQDLSAARLQADSEKAQALDDLRSTLKVEHESTQAELREQQAHELRGLRDQHAGELQRVADEHNRKLHELQSESARDLQSLRDEHVRKEQAARESQLTELDEQRQAQAAALQTAKIERDEALQKAQSEREQSEQLRDERIKSLELQIELAGQKLFDATAKTVELERLAEHARENVVKNKLDVDKIKDALASSLLHLEFIEGRTID